MRYSPVAILGALLIYTFTPKALEGNKAYVEPETPIVTVAGERPVLFEQVVEKAIPLKFKSSPEQYQKLELNAKCRTPKASPNAKVAYVYTYGGGVKTPLHALVGERASASAVEWLSKVDVLVTETDAPVFLWLSSYNAVLWNIQLAPGAELDGVVVSAYEGGAISNGASANRTGFITFRDSPNRSCYEKGRGMPVRVKDRVAGAKRLNPDIDTSGYERQWARDYDEAKTYFASTLPRLIGKRPDWYLNSSNGSSYKAVLVGPVPDAPMAAQPLTLVQMPSNMTPFWGSRKDAFKHFGVETR